MTDWLEVQSSESCPDVIDCNLKSQSLPASWNKDLQLLLDFLPWGTYEQFLLHPPKVEQQTKVSFYHSSPWGTNGFVVYLWNMCGELMIGLEVTPQKQPWKVSSLSEWWFPNSCTEWSPITSPLIDSSNSLSLRLHEIRSTLHKKSLEGWLDTQVRVQWAVILLGGNSNAQDRDQGTSASRHSWSHEGSDIVAQRVA